MNGAAIIVGDGRPLRFLVGIAGGWIVLRIAILWQQGMPLPDAIREVLPIARAAEVPVIAPASHRAVVSPAALPQPARAVAAAESTGRRIADPMRSSSRCWR